MWRLLPSLLGAPFTWRLACGWGPWEVSLYAPGSAATPSPSPLPRRLAWEPLCTCHAPYRLFGAKCAGWRKWATLRMSCPRHNKGTIKNSHHGRHEADQNSSKTLQVPRDAGAPTPNCSPGHKTSEISLINFTPICAHSIYQGPQHEDQGQGSHNISRHEAVEMYPQKLTYTNIMCTCSNKPRHKGKLKNDARTIAET